LEGEIKSSGRLSWRSDWICLLVIVAAAAIPRLLLLWITKFGVEADESIVGLMAKHVYEGRQWPIFYYGQPYMGSLEAILAAGMFYLTGVGSVGLKLVPFLFSLLHVVLVYALALRFTDRRGAIIAAILTALGPSGLILWSSKARGGFIELVVIGTWALIAATDLLREENPRLSRFAFVGAILGFGWWVNNQILFYALTIALVFFWHFVAGPNRRRFGIQVGLWGAGAALLGFIVGGWPFWQYNLFHEPRFSTVTFLLSQQGEGGFFDHLHGLFSTALPIIFGARRFWSEDDLFPFASSLAWIGYGLSYLELIAAWIGSIVRGRMAKQIGQSQNGLPLPYGLLLIFPIVLFLIFSASGFGWLSKEPRYLLPLYSVLFIIVGMAFTRLWARGGSIAAIPFAAMFLGINLASNYIGGVAVPGQPFVAEGQRVSADQQPLYDWLAANRYSHMFANYWIGYRAAFETGERVTFSRFRGPQNLRIPLYEMIGEEERSYSPYVLVPREAEIVKRRFADRGLIFRESSVSGYTVLDHVRPEFEVGPEIDLSKAEVETPTRQNWARNIIDGDIGSRWGSGTPQRPGMTIDIRLPRTYRVSELELNFGFFKTDAPRDLVVLGVDPAGKSCQLFDAAGAPLWEDLGSRWPIYLPPRVVNELKLIQLGTDPVFDWSLSEIKLYGESAQDPQR
jgi:hypothetical protein